MPLPEILAVSQFLRVPCPTSTPPWVWGGRCSCLMECVEVFYDALNGAAHILRKNVQLRGQPDHNGSDGIDATRKFMRVELTSSDQNVDMTQAKCFRQPSSNINVREVYPPPLKVGEIGLGDANSIGNFNLSQIEIHPLVADERTETTFDDPSNHVSVPNASDVQRTPNFPLVHITNSILISMRILQVD